MQYKPLALADLREAPLSGVTVASTYSGCGGMDIGFRLAGFEPVWANELDPHSAATYRATLGDYMRSSGILRLLRGIGFVLKQRSTLATTGSKL
jgi:predicted RNA methylase